MSGTEVMTFVVVLCSCCLLYWRHGER